MKALAWLGLGLLAFLMFSNEGATSVNTSVAPAVGFEFRSEMTFDNSTNETNFFLDRPNVIVNPRSPGSTVDPAHIAFSKDGLTLLDPPMGTCTLLPGEKIINGPDGRGGCTIEDENGNQFFLNPVGSRWPLNKYP